MKLPQPPISGLSWREHLTVLDFMVLLTGVVFSPPLLSIGLIGICVVGILDIPRGINPEWRSRIQDGIRDPFNWAFASLYLILLVGIWQTEDWSYYFERLRIKSALLAVPIGWWGLPRLRLPQRQFVLAFFVTLMALTALGVMANYLLNFAEIQQALLEGRALPVPRNHIRFSLVIALATICAAELANGRAFGHRWTWIIIGLSLFVFQHILAVRSGLACAYLGLSGFLLLHWYNRRGDRFAKFGLLALIIIPVVAYFTVPSLRAKIDYVRYELWLTSQGHENEAYSDAGRLASIRLGWELFRENPWTGVGPGNLRQEMDRLYAERLPTAEAKRPHNQYVSVLAGSGLFLFLLFLFAALYLLLGERRWRHPAFVAIWIILFASCTVENTLENSAGIGLFSFFLFFFRPDKSLEERIEGASRSVESPPPDPAPPPA